MTLFEQWKAVAYNQNQTREAYQAFWSKYFMTEKSVYEKLLVEAEPVSGTIPELAERYGISIRDMVGFLDGINESLKNGVTNPLETMDETTIVTLDYDTDLLYKNMVKAQADWLYELPQWDGILTPERRKELYKEQKSSTTIVKGKKIGRNDPCPCGSGKKYKYCCGRNN